MTGGERGRGGQDHASCTWSGGGAVKKGEIHREAISKTGN